MPLLKGAWHIAEVIDVRHREQPFDLIQAANCGVPGLFVDVDALTVLRLSSYERYWGRAYGAPQDMSVTYIQVLERQCLRDYDALFAPSRHLARVMDEELALAVDLVPTPAFLETDPDEWDNSWLTKVVQPGDPYFVFVGSLSQMKGTDLILAVLKDFPSLEMHFVGRNMLLDPDRLDRLIADVPGRIHYHGSQPDQRVYPLMAGAIALLAPSRVENLPNAVLEAALLGTPTLGTHGNSIEEIVHDGESEFLVSPDDTASLATAMRRLLSMSAEQRHSLGQYANRLVQETLSPGKTIPSLIRYYRKVIDAPRKDRLPRLKRRKSIESDLAAIACGNDYLIKQELQPVLRELEVTKERLRRLEHSRIVRFARFVERTALRLAEPLATNDSGRGWQDDETRICPTCDLRPCGYIERHRKPGQSFHDLGDRQRQRQSTG